MKEINIWKFSFGVWLRFQLIIVAVGVALSCATLSFSSIFGVLYFEAINGVLSAIGCTSYALIAYFWVQKASNNPDFNLKFILHQTGWLNVVFLFVLYSFFLIGNKEMLSSFAPMAGFSLFIIIVGQVAIYWTIYKWELNELSNAKLDNLLNELGTSPQES